MVVPLTSLVASEMLTPRVLSLNGLIGFTMGKVPDLEVRLSMPFRVNNTTTGTSLLWKVAVYPHDVGFRCSLEEISWDVRRFGRSKAETVGEYEDHLAVPSIQTLCAPPWSISVRRKVKSEE